MSNPVQHEGSASQRQNGRRAADIHSKAGLHRGQVCAVVLALVLSIQYLFAGGAPNTATEAVVATEEQVRAAFLYQLAQYADWPPDSFPGETAPMRFCSLGADDLAATLQTIVSGKRIQGRPITVSVVRDTPELARCHVAFIGFTREKKLRETFSKWSYPPVLLVGEASRFAELGGMVNLVIDSGRVSFEINLSVAAHARLQFRSQLLRLARIVSTKEGAAQ